MKDRILFLDHAGVLGGAELSLLDIARHFADRAEVVLFEDGPFRARLAEAGVAVSVMEAAASVQEVSRTGGLWHDLKSLAGVVKLARRVARHGAAYDVFYANSQKAFVVGAMAARLAGRPLVWHLRDLLTADHFSPSHRALVIFLANHVADRVIANSAATAEAFVEAGGVQSKVHVVHNGIDPAPFAAVTEAEVAALREALGLAGVPVVGVYSRLAPWKGQHVLLEALPALPGVHAVFVGAALFGGEAAYADELHALTERLGLQDRVHFLGFRRDVPALLRMVDVVVHTSIAAEPFGRVVVEGMLAERPVVATEAGGVLEIIEDGETGRLVPPGAADALARVLAELLAAPAEAARLAHAGHAAAHARFSRAQMLAGVEAQLRALHNDAPG